jgi:hypothetical protein
MPSKRLFEGHRMKRGIPGTSIRVCHYADERPGEYYSESGEPITEEMAARAGYDVVENRKEKRRRELLADAEQKIEDQIASEEAAIEEQIQKEEDARPSASEVHVQPGADLKAVHRGGGRYRIVDANRNTITDGLSKKEADRFISDAAAAAEEEAASAGG